jgi:multidrug efflux pump subunit AcrA (membrane-fusion protein)
VSVRKKSTLARARILPFVVVPLLAVGGIVAKKLAPVPVGATRVVRGTAVEAVYATGTVEAEARVFVRAKVGGSVSEILVKEGTPIKKGDLLARIDNPVITYDLERGQVELAAASAQGAPDAPRLAALREQARGLEADLGFAKQERERQDRLAKAGAATDTEVERARTRVTQLEAQLAANRAEERALRIDLGANQARSSANVRALASRVTDTEVRAPSDGIVLGKLVEVGEVVTMNQPLFKVGDVASLILEVVVDEADVARIRTPSPLDPKAAGSRTVVSLYAFPKQVFEGRVFDVMPDANRERKAFLVKVRFDAAPQGLRSGMSAEANVILGEKPDVVLAPAGSEAEGAVWLVEDGRARRRPIKVGVRDLLRFEVTEGISGGETIVTTGADKLTDGARVNATVKEPDRLEAIPATGGANRTAL